MVIGKQSEALAKCIEIAGSQERMANDIGVSQAAISKMVRVAGRMSAQYVLAAERLYGVSRHQLRPDIYPPDYPPSKQFISSLPKGLAA